MEQLILQAPPTGRQDKVIASTGVLSRHLIYSLIKAGSLQDIEIVPLGRLCRHHA